MLLKGVTANTHYGPPHIFEAVEGEGIFPHRDVQDEQR